MPNALPNPPVRAPGALVAGRRVPLKEAGTFARLACVLLVCVYFGRLQELWSPLQALHLGMLALGLGLVAALGSGLAPLARHLKSPQGKKIAGIFVFCLLSVPLSVWPTRSLIFSFLEFGLVLVYLGILLTCIRTPDGVLLLLKAMAACALLLALASLLTGGEGRVAASGTYDPNDIALVMVITLPVLKHLFSTYKSALPRLGLALAALVMLAAVAHTGSRGGLLGLGSVILFWLFADKSVSAGKKILLVSVACLAVLVIAPDMLWERMGALSGANEQKDYNLDARGGRIEIWKRALNMMADSPLTGVGAGAFAEADGIYQGAEGGRWSVTHNSFLEVGATIGVVGLALFLSLLWTAFASMMRLAASREFAPGDPRPGMALALAASLVGYACSGFFLSQGFGSIVYFLVGLTMILTAVSADDSILAAKPAQAASRLPRRSSRPGPDAPVVPGGRGRESILTRRR